MTIPTNLTFDVGPIGPTTSTSIAAWEFLPDSTPRALLFAIPGGTYRKDYWHMAIPGHPGYSFAEHMVGHGYAVVAVDNYGTGDSTRPASGDDATLENMAAANARVAAELRSRRPDVPLVGVGHSMGAALSVMQQAQHRSFDAIAPLGYGYQPLAGFDDTLALDAQLAASAERFSAMAPCPDGNYEIDRDLLRPQFHWDDVPDAVIAADNAVATVLPRPALHVVGTTPTGRPYAAAVDVPVFQAWGERDNTPNPHGDGAFFTSCPDYTMFVLPQSCHCHNFASTRHQLWDRLAGWLSEIV